MQTHPRRSMRTEMSEFSRPQHRSFLFVPGSQPDRFVKALASGADAVIVDLEDAVAPDAKAQAHRALAEWVSPKRPVLIRVNARNTPWFAEDAQLLKLRGVAGVILPKAESAQDVVALISATRTKTPVFPLIETAQGMWNALDIAKAPFVQQLMFGTLDFIADMGMASDGHELDTFRAQLVMISRIAGILPPVDGVTPSIDDSARLTAETTKGKRWGFGGKLCIHPKQIPAVNACYTPTDSEIAWAQRVIEESGKANGAVVSVDGKMVDRPVVLQAQRVMNLVRA
jgi:citrate lyase subunit beta/citryl-CoA lyase